MSEFTKVNTTRDEDGQILAGVYGRGASTDLSFAAGDPTSVLLPITGTDDPSAVVELTTSGACYYKMGGEDVEATNSDSDILIPGFSKMIRRSPGQTHFSAMGVTGAGVISATEVK
jgi:hypothetical protein